MKKLLLLIPAISLILSLVAANATVISFTEAEGYANGSLYAQDPISGYGWVQTYGGDGYVVDTSNGGSLTVTGGGPMRYLAPLSIVAGETISFSMDFQFIGLDTTNTSASQSVGALQLGTSVNYNTEIKASLGRASWVSSGFYNVQTYQGTGTPSANVDPALMGLTTTGGTLSDHLRLTVDVAAINGSTNHPGLTDYTLTLTNLDTGTTVVTMTGYRDLSTISELFLTVSGPSSGALTITQLEYNVTAVPEPATTAMLLGAACLLGVHCSRKRR